MHHKFAEYVLSTKRERIKPLSSLDKMKEKEQNRISNLVIIMKGQSNKLNSLNQEPPLQLAGFNF